MKYSLESIKRRKRKDPSRLWINNNEPITTFIPKADYVKFIRIAKKEGVTKSVLAQSMILKCLGDVEE